MEDHFKKLYDKVNNLQGMVDLFTMSNKQKTFILNALSAILGDLARLEEMMTVVGKE